jgi:oxaloacetate decarboxylase beta subunit
MFENGLNALWYSMGIANLEWGQALMILVGAGLIFLAIRKGFEPLLLLPIGFGCILANVPVAGLAEDAVGQLILQGKPEHLAALAAALGSPTRSNTPVARRCMRPSCSPRTSATRPGCYTSSTRWRSAPASRPC